MITLYYKLLLFYITLLAGSSQAHLVMGEPKAFTGTQKPPVKAQEFPCQNKKTGPLNTYKVGDNITMNFNGQPPSTATHGGGTCQFSLSTDIAPSKNSKWKAFATVQGGCPAYTTGNTPVNDPFQFIFQIPPSVPNGKYTFAWTWFAKMTGELYMNCAAVEVQGSNSKKKFEELDYPDMFTADNAACKTNGIIQVPNPGKNVLINDNPQQANIPQCGGKRDLEARAMPSATGKPDVQLRIALQGNALKPYKDAKQLNDPAPVYVSAPAGSGGAAPTGSGDAASTSAGGAAPTSGGGGGTGGSPTSGSPSGQSPAGQSPAGQSPAGESPAGESPAGQSPAGESPAGESPAGESPAGQSPGFTSGGGGSCQDGAWKCIDGTSSSRCANGQWSATQPVAAGTKCQPGISQNLQLTRG